MLKKATISLFLLIVVGLIFVSNFVVYKAAALAFDISQPLQLAVLGGTLGFLSVSFILASIIGSWYYNWGTRTYYKLSAVWMGFFVYAFFASVVYAVAVAAFPPLVRIGPWLFLVAFVVSLYGVLHARKIVVTKVSVSLPHLPPSWKNRTVAWISDIHLGQLHGPHFAQRVTSAVMALSPDIVFVGGDLYDGTGAPDIPELTAPFKKLSAPHGVYYITGNHEEYGDRERFLSAVESVGMRVLRDELVDIDGLQLVGVDYKNTTSAEAFATILSGLNINRATASILLKHEPRHVDIAHAAGISLQISGHTHKGQQWPFAYVAELTYRGFVYGLNRCKDMQVYTSSGVGTWGPPVRVGTDGEIVLFTFN